MSSATWALQKALFTTLSQSASVKSQLGDPARLYDEVPRNALMPYLTFTEDRQSDWNTQTEPGSEHLITLHVWSRAKGRKDVKLCADAVIESLRDATPALSGHSLVNLTFRGADFLRQSDGQTYLARLRFRAITEPNP